MKLNLNFKEPNYELLIIIYVAVIVTLILFFG